MLGFEGLGTLPFVPLNVPIGDTGERPNEKSPDESGPFSIRGGDGQKQVFGKKLLLFRGLFQAHQIHVPQFSQEFVPQQTIYQLYKLFERIEPTTYGLVAKRPLFPSHTLRQSTATCHSESCRRNNNKSRNALSSSRSCPSLA